MGGSPAGGSSGNPNSVYNMCGDGQCSYYEMPGSLAPCPKDCWGTCGNGIKEPQDMWTCPNDGAPPPVMPPPANGYVEITDNIGKDCTAFMGFGFVEAVCPPAQAECLDSYTNYADPVPAGDTMNTIQCPGTSGYILTVPPGTYTYSAGIMTTHGLTHLVNKMGVIVVSGQTTMVSSQ